MGLPGQTDHQRARNAVNRVKDAAERASVIVGAVAGDSERALCLKEGGVCYIVLSTALRLLSNRIKELVAEMGG